MKPGDKFFLFLPDLHSLETNNEKTINQNSLENARLFIAAGIDPTHSNTYLYRQSRVPAHAQLQWVLNWYTYMGEAQRMTQFKDKASKKGESVPVSLLTYPILQAADILLYDANYIPVGEDQKQHLELTRDIAQRFNNKFGQVFTIPEVWEKQLAFTARTEGARIRSLTDPTKKMSKSDENSAGNIMLNDSPEVARKKIMSATTDSIGMIDWNWDTQPGITNLLQLLQLLTHSTKEEVLATWVGKERYGDLKKAVADVVVEFLTNLQTKQESLSLEEVESILASHEEQAALLAHTKLNHVEQIIGLR